MEQKELLTVIVADDETELREAVCSMIPWKEIGFRLVGSAVHSLGLAGRVRMVGFDTNVKCIDLLQSGAVSALIVQNPYAMGYLGVEAVCNLLDGQTYRTAELLDTATRTVTKETMFTIENQKALFSFG